MKNPSPQEPREERVASWSLFGIGSLLLVIAILFDPIGPSPDSGIIDLGTSRTKWLLGIFGSFFLLAAIWSFLRKKI